MKSKEKELSFSDDSTTAFRIFNGEGDGIGGLIIDYYAGYAVFLGITRRYIHIVNY